MLCGKCSKITGVILLLVGIVFLLKDLGVWNVWGISLWSIVVIVAGLVGLCSSGCADCQKMRK